MVVETNWGIDVTDRFLGRPWAGDLDGVRVVGPFHTSISMHRHPRRSTYRQIRLGLMSQNQAGNRTYSAICLSRTLGGQLIALQVSIVAAADKVIADWARCVEIASRYRPNRTESLPYATPNSIELLEIVTVLRQRDVFLDTLRLFQERGKLLARHILLALIQAAEDVLDMLLDIFVERHVLAQRPILGVLDADEGPDIPCKGGRQEGGIQHRFSPATRRTALPQGGHPAHESRLVLVFALLLSKLMRGVHRLVAELLELEMSKAHGKTNLEEMHL